MLSAVQCFVVENSMNLFPTKMSKNKIIGAIKNTGVTANLSIQK